MFFKHNSDKVAVPIQQQPSNPSTCSAPPMSEIVRNFNLRLTLNRFADYPIEDEQDIKNLLFHIQCMIEDTNKMPGRICRTSDLRKKTELDILSNIGFFIRVPTKASIQSGRSIQSEIYAYQCLVTDQQYQEFLSMRQKILQTEIATAKQNKRLELRQIHEAFDRYKSNATLIKAVQNSKDLLNTIAAYNIEIMAIPMEQNVPPKALPGVSGENAPTYFYYRPRFFDYELLADTEFNSFEPLKRLDTFTWYNISPNNTTHDFFIFMLGAWGAVLHNDDTFIREAPPQRIELFTSVKKMYSDLLGKINYLYDSLHTYGLIETDSQIYRTAFFILLYDTWYESIRDLYNSMPFTDLEFIESANTDELIEFLRGKSFNDNSVSYFLAIRDYLHGIQMPLNKIQKKYEEHLKRSDEEAAKKRYVEELINGGPAIKTYTIEDTDHIEPYQFEELVAALFRSIGYEASVTKKAGDQGVDVIASKGTTQIAIQAKCYPNSVVGNGAVQAVVAGMNYYHANKACVVTNSTFTQSAIELAKANNVELWDRTTLQDLLKRYPIRKL